MALVHVGEALGKAAWGLVTGWVRGDCVTGPVGRTRMLSENNMLWDAVNEQYVVSSSVGRASICIATVHQVERWVQSPPPTSFTWKGEQCDWEQSLHRERDNDSGLGITLRDYPLLRGYHMELSLAR